MYNTRWCTNEPAGYGISLASSAYQKHLCVEPGGNALSGNIPASLDNAHLRERRGQHGKHQSCKMCRTQSAYPTGSLCQRQCLKILVHPLSYAPVVCSNSVSAVLTEISRRSLLVLISIPMIIDNFNITCITIMPLKTNTPLFVNADSELPLPISF